MKVKVAVTRRKIDYLWHFTRVENLESILTNGLIPRSALEVCGASVEYNDSCRLDGYTDANCLSIGHPNYKMFYSLRCDYPGQEWVVIGIEPEVLWLQDCAFCYENAASGNVTSIPIDGRKGEVAFEGLFLPADGKPDRTILGLPDNCPTNPQAEVLVFGTIHPKNIVGAFVQNSTREKELKAKFKDFDFVHHRSLFLPRKDYKHW